MTKKRKNIFDITSGRCFYCGCELECDNFHMDHLIAKSKGGKVKYNLVPACPDCNNMKSDLSIEEFRDKISSLLHNSIQGRMISKYYKPEITEIKFFFEGELSWSED